ncbi:MAG: sigma-70 family RNA polymerase sigma factor [Acidimicrobiales bacterium]|jgi:RNA polymerase sigma factor for flagellar operon FliA
MAVRTRSVCSRHKTLDQIWARYTSDRSIVYRNELVVAYQALVNETVQRLPGYIVSYWDPDDLRSYGQDGLVRAITRWDGSDNSKFEPYARRCIRGSIFDELRRLDWMPRSARRRVIDYRTTYDSLVVELGRNPRPEEVCAAMGLTGRQASELMSELNASQLLHLEGRPPSQSRGDGAFLDVLSDDGAEPEAEIMASAELEALNEAMATLGSREHTVLFLTFFGGLTQEQIGRIIGVGGPQVCKIHGSAIRKLRSVLGSSRTGTEHALAS